MTNSSESNASNSSSNSLSAHDQQFLEKLAKSSEGEVENAKLIESKTSNPQVKEFAQRMIHDHTLLDGQVKTILQKYGMSVPPAMTPEQQQLHSELEKESGQKLEQTYVQAEVKEHQQDIQMITPEADHEAKLEPSDPTVGELAEEARPVLEQHLKLAEEVARDVGVNPASASTR
jgi:putative membrane protein